jgi:hypothetical protein
LTVTKVKKDANGFTLAIDIDLWKSDCYCYIF